ncbi:hypothetical protein Bca4012_064951 [Brassica carinata]
MEVFCVCGNWNSNDCLQWEFHVDLKKNASFICIEEDLLFEDLMKIVSEDFSVKEEEISLSYGMSLDMKSTVECLPPISIGNTRHLRGFIGKIKGFDGTCQLCVKVNTDSASCNTQAADSFASHVPLNITPVFRSTVQRGKQSHLYESVSTVPLNALPDFSPIHIGLSPTTRGADDIKVNSYFKTKGELMLRMKKWALEWKFEYKTVSSNKSRVLLSCIDDNCTWRMRATKLPLSDFFVVKKYVHDHTCDTTHRKANHRQASAKLLGSLICSNYGEKKEGLKPKQIMEQVRMLGVHINYKQAWRVREEAQFLVRGTPEVSYYNLSRGFSLMKRAIAVDGTFLKGKFNGTLVAACAQDEDYHLYPLAFAVVDDENEASWKWFFRGLKQMILRILIHLLRNITPKYSKTGLLPLVESAADAYTCHEFWLIFKDIMDKCPELAKYLEDSDFWKWARCYAPANRYNIMTTNIAESLNSMLKMPRELPVISLLETIRLTLTTWFFERRKAAAKHKHLVTPKVVKKLVYRLGAAMVLNVYQVDQSEFEIPCIHAISAAKHIKRDENRYVDSSHLTETWAKAYAGSIHPGGELSTSNYPVNIDELSCPPPATKKRSGRPPTKRKRSVGEFGVPGSKSQSHRCSRCGIGGHNKSTCQRPIG